MAAEDMLNNAGMHFDDLNKIRVLEPEVSQQTSNLKDECHEFVTSKWTLFETLLWKFI